MSELDELALTCASAGGNYHCSWGLIHSGILSAANRVIILCKMYLMLQIGLSFCAKCRMDE